MGICFFGGDVILGMGEWYIVFDEFEELVVGKLFLCIGDWFVFILLFGRMIVVVVEEVMLIDCDFEVMDVDDFVECLIEDKF